MTPSSNPPPLLERIVARILGDDPSTPYVIGDLREELRARRPGPTAWLWYAVVGISLAFRIRWERKRRPSPAPPTARARPPHLGDRMRTDLRQAIRFVLRRPAFTAAVVLTVALSIAATTLAFAVVDGVLLEPLPYPTADRLVAVWEDNPGGNPRNVVSPANYLTWREELESLDAVASIIESSTTMLGQGQPERIGFVQAAAAYFEIVGAEPLIGRLYDERDGLEVVVLSESFWRRRFGADPSIVGRALDLGPLGSLTVVGVLPDRFDFEVETSFGGIGSRDVWIPTEFPPEAREAGGRYLQVIARLASGATVEGAQEEASALAARLAETFPDRQLGWEVRVVPLQEDMVGDVSTTILVVFGAVCLVLLIACANVANLLMTRASERQQEMAVRAALGAGRRRLVQQLLMESALLSTIGGALGLLLAYQGLSSLVASAPDVPRIAAVTLDTTVVAFALLATAATAMLFGLAPALSVTRGSAASWLGARGTGERREAHRIRGALVIAQVSLSLVLLVGAGLLVRSLVNRLEIGVGFATENLLTTDVQLGGGAYEDNRQVIFEDLVERVQAVPGVRAASAITWPPLAGGGTRHSVWRLDRPVPGPGEEPGADIRWVHRDYHATMGIPLRAGRTFGQQDGADAPTVVLVNETGAERIWPGEDPLGKRIAMEWGDTLVAEVVGVVGNIRHNGPDTDPYSMFYFDHRQHSPFNFMSLVVRTEAVEPVAVLPGIRAALARIDPDLPLWNVRPMEELFADAIRRERFATVSLGVFAALALLLAAIGVYGVMAHATQRRTQEIGIRMALGADRSGILGMVVRQGMVQVVAALVIGTLGAFGLSRLLEGLVFGVSTSDPLTFAATALLLATVGFVACWLPARRASGIDPVDSIRSD